MEYGILIGLVTLLSQMNVQSLPIGLIPQATPVTRHLLYYDELLEIEQERSFENAELTTPEPNGTQVIKYPVMEAEVVTDRNEEQEEQPQQFTNNDYDNSDSNEMPQETLYMDEEQQSEYQNTNSGGTVPLIPSTNEQSIVDQTYEDYSDSMEETSKDPKQSSSGTCISEESCALPSEEVQDKPIQQMTLGKQNTFQAETNHKPLPNSVQTIKRPVPQRNRSKKPYSYFFLYRKLWYVPLFFSVWFMFYVFALVVKSIARHRIEFPAFKKPHHEEHHDYHHHDKKYYYRRQISDYQDLDYTTYQVTEAIRRASFKYM